MARRTTRRRTPPRTASGRFTRRAGTTRTAARGRTRRGAGRQAGRTPAGWLT